MLEILADRRKQIHEGGEQPFQMECEKHSLAGSVSQRACVFCGSRVVLYPIADALHVIHGPWVCRLHLGHPRSLVLRSRTAPDELLHRPPRDRM